MNEKCKAAVEASIALLNGAVPPFLAIGAGGVVLYHCAMSTINLQSGEYWAVTGAMLTPYIGKLAVNGVKKVIKK